MKKTALFFATLFALALDSPAFSQCSVQLTCCAGGSSGSGTGDVTGPASATADTVALFADTTGKALKVSKASISAAGELSLLDGSGNLRFLLNGGGTGAVSLSSGGSMSWYNDTDIVSGSADLQITRAAAGILGLSNAAAGGAVLEFQEMSAPAAPAANKARLFTQDNGAGKTQLVVRFASGAVQVIATEP